MARATTTAPLLQHLTTGTGEPVLVVEFQAWTTAPRLSRLLAERLPGHPVHQLDPVRAQSLDRPQLSLVELAARSTEELVASGPPAGRVFIAAHCSAAALSLHMAELLQVDHEVTVLLVGPSWPDEAHLHHRFAEALSSLRVPARACPSLDGDPTAVVDGLMHVLREEIDVLAAERGISGAADAFAELLGWHRGWLSFLLACHRDPWESWDTTAATEVVVMTSPDDEGHVPGMPRERYSKCSAPVLREHDPITAELADVVAEHVHGRVAQAEHR